MIKVLLADDHQIVLDGLSMLIENEPDMEKVQEVTDGELVLKVLETVEVDVAVLDIEMPRKDGIETAKAIRDQYPDIKVLILTMYNTKSFIEQLVQAGAVGYILKNRGKEELIDAIRTVSKGSKYFGEAVTETLINSLANNHERNAEPIEVIITKREKEILQLIIQGLSTPQIAKQLFIANSTVESHRRNLIDKTGVSNTKALIAFAYENGLVNKTL